MSENETHEEGTGPARPRPAERFAAPVHRLDLSALAAGLRAESAPTRHGHRQMTIWHNPPVTVLLFAFEPGGVLADHQAHGAVTIHLIEGAVTVQAAAQTYELTPATLVTLAPDVPHSVTATQASTLLVMVALVPNAA
ncbi:MAG: AraC family ligand binding domain-containing protein [Chloroflexota bacterium]|nr:AraC family ligand binding domain-containing protein [Chloroflexota bacterium]